MAAYRWEDDELYAGLEGPQEPRQRAFSVDQISLADRQWWARYNALLAALTAAKPKQPNLTARRSRGYSSPRWGA
jgi:hypothetical protein